MFLQEFYVKIRDKRMWFIVLFVFATVELIESKKGPHSEDFGVLVPGMKIWDQWEAFSSLNQSKASHFCLRFFTTLAVVNNDTEISEFKKFLLDHEQSTGKLSLFT